MFFIIFAGSRVYEDFDTHTEIACPEDTLVENLKKLYSIKPDFDIELLRVDQKQYNEFLEKYGQVRTLKD